MLFAAIAPVFLIIAAGFIVRRLRILTAEADASLLRICVNILYPSLIIATILGNDALREIVNVWMPPLTGVALVLLGYLTSYLVAKLLGLQPGRETRTFTYVTGLYNYGYTAIPVVDSLFGAKTLGVLFTHNLGVEITFWMGASFILSGHAEKGGWRRAINTPVIAILVSLLLNFAHVTEHLPAWIPGAFKMLGASAIPMALLLLGATLSDFLGEAKPSRSGAVAIAGASLLRMGLLPLAFLAMARWLPCSPELRRVLVVQAAMPAAMLPVVLSKHYGGDAGLAVQIVFATTILALFTMKYWVQFGLHFVGY